MAAYKQELQEVARVGVGALVASTPLTPSPPPWWPRKTGLPAWEADAAEVQEAVAAVNHVVKTMESKDIAPDAQEVSTFQVCVFQGGSRLEQVWHGMMDECARSMAQDVLQLSAERVPE